MLKVGVILSGCGVLDGSEIHEATLLLLAIDRRGAQAVCLAPDIDQADVVDHAAGLVKQERRGVLAESARIARGRIKSLHQAKAEELDAVMLPGGYGAVKNLCNFAKDGARCEVDPHLSRLLKDMHAAGKPIGAACIAPVILARLFGSESPELTIGSELQVAKAIEAMGARHKNTAATAVLLDKTRRLATTPCYMLAERISQVEEGMDNLVRAVLELAALPRA
ncbi:MAG: isoprenoid biosynthesis glyoxalase ElbB [Elusimicrobia bacterium]|nr:isoprenoid biosynthesis glyoxalase ElbB [Elusimicrobiota bacterium]